MFFSGASRAFYLAIEDFTMYTFQTYHILPPVFEAVEGSEALADVFSKVSMLDT